MGSKDVLAFWYPSRSTESLVELCKLEDESYFCFIARASNPLLLLDRTLAAVLFVFPTIPNLATGYAKGLGVFFRRAAAMPLSFEGTLSGFTVRVVLDIGSFIEGSCSSLNIDSRLSRASSVKIWSSRPARALSSNGSSSNIGSGPPSVSSLEKMSF